jgi:ABC-type proline/glycine betaine transport system permease subunit
MILPSQRRAPAARLRALLASCIVGIRMGVWSARSPARVVQSSPVSVLQTIPSLALLAFLIALFNRIGMIRRSLRCFYMVCCRSYVIRTVA